MWARSWEFSTFASDIPPACDTRDALFQEAGRTGISPSKHAPLPNLTQFLTVI